MPLRMNRIPPAEAKRTIWFAEIPAETNPKDLLDPRYWTHCAETITAGDRIECAAADGSFFGELFVLSADRRFLDVKWRDFHAFKEVLITEEQRKVEEVVKKAVKEAEPSVSGTKRFNHCEVYHGGAYGKWSVRPIGGGDPLVMRLPNEGKAIAWAKEYERKIESAGKPEAATA